MIIIFMGPPGSGKGTQSESIVDTMSVIQISTGDILRSAVNEKTELGLTAHRYMESGDLVPDEVVIGIIKDRILKEDCLKGFILDGFPRTEEQAKALDLMMEKNNRKINHVVYFDVPEQELIVRLLGRSEKEGRSDDKLETIKTRLRVFKEKTEKLLEYYKTKGLVRFVDGTGGINDVKSRLHKALGIK